MISYEELLTIIFCFLKEKHFKLLFNTLILKNTCELLRICVFNQNALKPINIGLHTWNELIDYADLFCYF